MHAEASPACEAGCSTAQQQQDSINHITILRQADAPTLDRISNHLERGAFQELMGLCRNLKRVCSCGEFGARVDEVIMGLERRVCALGVVVLAC